MSVITIETLPLVGAASRRLRTSSICCTMMGFRNLDSANLDGKIQSCRILAAQIVQSSDLDTLLCRVSDTLLCRVSAQVSAASAPHQRNPTTINVAATATMAHIQACSSVHVGSPRH